MPDCDSICKIRAIVSSNLVTDSRYTKSSASDDGKSGKRTPNILEISASPDNADSLWMYLGGFASMIYVSNSQVPPKCYYGIIRERITDGCDVSGAHASSEGSFDDPDGGRRRRPSVTSAGYESPNEGWKVMAGKSDGGGWDRCR